MHLRRHVHDLVKAAGDEIHELHFDHRPHAHQRRADGRAHDGRLGDGRVDHPILAELLQHPGRHLERAAIDADVFAQTERRRIALHLFPDSLANGVKVSQCGHAFTSSQVRPLSLVICVLAMDHFARLTPCRPRTRGQRTNDEGLMTSSLATNNPARNKRLPVRSSPSRHWPRFGIGHGGINFCADSAVEFLNPAAGHNLLREQDAFRAAGWDLSSPTRCNQLLRHIFGRVVRGMAGHAKRHALDEARAACPRARARWRAPTAS